jgi:L-lactate utilization protein LutC
MNTWDTLKDTTIIQKTAQALTTNGMKTMIVESGVEAKKMILDLIPQHTEVFAATSVTLDTIGVSSEIDTSERYESVRNKLNSMNRETQSSEMQRIGSSPDWIIGSVHAVTEKGEVIIASNTGSQLAPESYGANHVIFVIGAQKIVNDIEEGFKRIYEHSLPLEAERARKAYGAPGSNVSKILIINKEIKPERITVILVKEVLGF